MFHLHILATCRIVGIANKITVRNKTTVGSAHFWTAAHHIQSGLPLHGSSSSCEIDNHENYHDDCGAIESDTCDITKWDVEETPSCVAWVQIYEQADIYVVAY